MKSGRLHDDDILHFPFWNMVSSERVYNDISTVSLSAPVFKRR